MEQTAGGASYDPAGDWTRRHRGARPSTIRKMEAKRRRNERFRMLAATDPDLLAARHWRLKRLLRKMSNAQREHRSSS